jgi:hypothetical protein
MALNMQNRRFRPGQLPERLYVVEEGSMMHRGGPGPFEYFVEEIESRLVSCFSGHSDEFSGAEVDWPWVVESLRRALLYFKRSIFSVGHSDRWPFSIP